MITEVFFNYACLLTKRTIQVQNKFLNESSKMLGGLDRCYFFRFQVIVIIQSLKCLVMLDNGPVIAKCRENMC